VDGISPALALFLLDNIGDEPGWMDRIDLKIRMWLEPLLGSIRIDPGDTDQPLIWDLDDDETRIAIVLLRTDEAEACA
jgi:hypothetical protein